MAKRTSEKFGLLAIGDMHVGSVLGIWPKRFTLASGNQTTLNPYQEKLTGVFYSSLEKAYKELGNKPYHVLINGDVVDGQVKRSNQIMSANLDDQIDAADEILRPICDRAKKSGGKVLMTRGTEIHTGDKEISIAKAMGAITLTTNEKLFAVDMAFFDLNGIKTCAFHHFPPTSRAYLEATMYSIIMNNHRLNMFRAGLEPPRLWITGHRHVGGRFSDMAGTMVCLPAWQGLTRHCFKVVPTSLGYHGLATFNPVGREAGEMPDIRFHGEFIDQSPMLKL